jgi:hypothetical protein
MTAAGLRVTAGGCQRRTPEDKQNAELRFSQGPAPIDVPFWHKGDVLKASPDVRFRGVMRTSPKSMSVPDL